MKAETRNSVWVKICGTTNLDDAQAAVEAGADAIGFVFAESARRVDPDKAAEIAHRLPGDVEKVGVFVNESAERIRDIAIQAGLTAVQLHGDETPEFARQLVDEGRTVFKAVPVQGGFAARMIAFAERGHVQALLLDTAAALRGGTGASFDLRAVAEYMPAHGGDMRLIVAGGLTPASVAHAIRILRPWGVDVASGVEREPGKKDHQKVKEFIQAAKKL